MRFHWQQFSPGEKEALLRHFVLHKRNATVSAEKVCQALKNTHYLTCVSPGNGATLVEFVSAKPGIRAGVAVSDDLTDGIYQAALRAFGLELEEEPLPAEKKSRATRKAGRVVHV